MRDDDVGADEISFRAEGVEEISKRNFIPKIYPPLIRSEIWYALT